MSFGNFTAFSLSTSRKEPTIILASWIFSISFNFKITAFSLILIFSIFNVVRPLLFLKKTVSKFLNLSVESVRGKTLTSPLLLWVETTLPIVINSSLNKISPLSLIDNFILGELPFFVNPN
ncbi:hypothetical protein ES705_43150 [subsurface metagenome]